MPRSVDLLSPVGPRKQGQSLPADCAEGGPAARAEPWISSSTANPRAIRRIIAKQPIACPCPSGESPPILWMALETRAPAPDSFEFRYAGCQFTPEHSALRIRVYLC